jgi:hypothetical protein
MTDAGHSTEHFPQPTHFSGLILATIPLKITMAFIGQTLTQHPHATQSLSETNAFLFFLIFFSAVFSMTDLLTILFYQYSMQQQMFP